MWQSTGVLLECPGSGELAELGHELKTLSGNKGLGQGPDVGFQMAGQGEPREGGFWKVAILMPTQFWF